MMEKGFTKRLKEKLISLRPSETHKEEDWGLLFQQLETALPQKKKRYAFFILPFLLGLALVGTNGVWWLKYQRISAEKEQAINQLATFQNEVKPIQKEPISIKTDTLWRTIYRDRKTTVYTVTPSSDEAKSIKGGINNPLNRQEQAENKLQSDSITSKINIAIEKTDINIQPFTANNSSKQFGDILPLQANIRLLDIPKKPFLALSDNSKPTIQNAPITRPNYQIGLKTEFASPISAGLMPNIGFGMGLYGSLGFSKHWRISGSMGMVYLNYTATDKTALLGSLEELPTIANSPNSLTQMHMKNQGCMRYDLNLQYLFTPIKKLKPFISAGIGGMFMQAYQMDLKVQNMQNMMIHQSNYQVNPQKHDQQMYRLSVGFELPLSKHIGVNIEGYYMREWRKAVALAPDFIGIQTGVHYNF